MILSAIKTVSEIISVRVPWTVRSPVITKSPSKVSFSSLRRNCNESNPSSKSASSPDPAPSLPLYQTGTQLIEGTLVKSAI